MGPMGMVYRHRSIGIRFFDSIFSGYALPKETKEGGRETTCLNAKHWKRPIA